MRTTSRFEREGARAATIRLRGRAAVFFLLLSIFSTALTGCAGGGGGGGATEPTPTPSANVPAVTGLNPASGPMAGSIPIQISGTALSGATVTIGGRAASGVAVNAEGTRIDAVIPAGAVEGAVDVVVTTPAGTATSPVRFIYNGSPAISFLSPASGPQNGGTNLTILGSAFDGTVTVEVGGVAATSVAVSADKTQITCVTPPGSAVGPADIAITASAAGSVRAIGAFTYTSAVTSDPPAISSVSPVRGPMSGGTTLVILGARFSGNIVVTVGGRAATNVAVNAAQTQITCTTPASTAAGAADVVVLSDRAGSTTAAGAFTYNAAPTIASISPATGPQGGGNTFTITGTNFDGAVTVTVGGRGATGVSVDASKTQITGQIPGSTSTGPKDVVVRSDSNGSATLAGGYTYNGPPPTLSRIQPTTGPNRGGTLVTIDGANFRGTMSVTFGGVAATGVTVNGARTQLTCRTPAFAGTGPVDVVVTSDTHGSVTATGAFTYNSNPAPVLTTISPNNGPLAGGTPVTITGANFFGTLTLTFGGVAATGIVVSNGGTRIDAVVPRATVAGAVDVFLDSTTHGQVTLTSGYTYNPAPVITGIFPTSGPKAGGTQVIISGANFFNAVSVEIGTVIASVTSVDPLGNQITLVTNASPTTGTKNVTVTSSSHGTLVRANGFTYTPNPQPTITAISPNNGPLAGGTVVTITGTNFEGTVNVTVGGVGVGAVVVDGSKTSLSFVTPPAATPGARDVVVGSDSHGTVTLGGGFTYNPAPTIATIAPDNGPSTGGTPVTITGTGFGGAVTVRFGFLTATSVVVNSSTQLTCVSPAGTANQSVTVTVDSTTNGVATKAAGFRYNPLPTISTLTPDNGPLAGGNTVVIAGANLGGTVNVTFGNAAATTVSSTANSVTVIAPPGAATGLVAVSVFSSTNGPATLANAYTYNPAPTLSLPLVPNNGPLAGGTDVTINGANFGGTVNVTVGGRAATVQSVNAAKTQVVARTPAGAAAGLVDVIVSSSTNGSVTAASSFTYNPPVEIFAVNPNTGAQAGGTSVTIDGNNFFNTVNVTIGSTPATVVSFNPFRTQVTVLTGASPDFGVKDVTVSSSSHGTATLANAFTVVPPLPTITNIEPAAGALDGGTTVTLTGTSFEGTVNVTFGNAAAQNVQVNAAKTSLTCVTPAGVAPGAVNVTLTSSTHGTVTRLSGYTYNPRMTITAVNPNQGPLGGFNAITIDGTNFEGNVTVTIGGNPLVGTSVNAAKTRITGTVPAGTGVGGVALVVTSDTHGTVQSTYTYNNTPAINTVNPPNGPIAGGTVVDIGGSGFLGTVTVKFGATFASAAAATVQSVAPDGSSVRVLTPPGASAGPTNVFVSSSTNGQAVRTNGFTYNSPPQATGVVPNNGPLAGGTNVIINGGGFFGTVTATFGGVAGTVLSVDTAGNTISALTPAGAAAGAVDVVVNASAGGSSTITGGFTYNPLPTTTNVTPNEGPQQGGTPITITGTGFGGTVNVTVCGVPATNVVVNLTRTQINCRTAATATPGLGDIEILSSTNGRVIAPNAFTYNPSPTVSSIIPNNGPQAGFTAITVNGTGFRGTVTATIGGTAVTELVQVNDTQFTAKTPPSLTEGARDVVVTSTLNGTVNVTNGYTYNPSVVIGTLTPPNGPLAGGNAVVISGANFGGTVNVTFGTIPATVTFQTLTQLNVVAPAGLAAGPVNVAVESSTSGLASAPGAYTYNAPMTIGTLNPDNGPLIGGTLISMSGTNFIDVTGVTVDGVPTAGVTVSSPTNIQFLTPAGVFPGPVDVIVTSDSRGTVTGTGAFTYNPEPFIANVTPQEGPLFGGTNVTITGANFATPLSVRFGTLTASTVSVTTDTIVVVSPPATAAGPVTVTVDSTPNGPFSIFPGFTYNNTPTGANINPNNGPLAGGNAVIITGTDFDPTTTVFFGTRAVTVTSVSPDRTTITGTVPRGASPGAVDVQINSPASGTLNVTNGYFYNPPISVASLAPTSGPVSGGQLVTITGQNLFGPPNVKIGTLDVLSPTVSPSGTILQFMTPTSPVTGTFDVVITSSTFGSFIATQAYTYVPVLDVQTLSPTVGSVAGGTTVNVTGTGFFNVNVVEFGGVPARSFTTNVSGTLITAITERNSAGLKDLRVASTSNGEDTLTGAFTYVPDYVVGAPQPTFANPVGLVVKDMNGDGKPDLVVGNQLDDSVIFYFNSSVPGSTPSFAATANVSFTTGNEPTGIAVADFDNDGLQDVITANKLSNDLTLLLSVTAPGSAAPTFTALPPISNTGGPSAIVAEDFNGDGRVDVAVTEELLGVVNVRLNTTVSPGSPTLNGVGIVGAGSAPTAIFAADLNGDGKLDLVTANRDSNSVSILRNNCSPASTVPSFSNVSTLILPAGSSPQGVAAADLNGDGRKDLLISNSVARNIAVLINTTTDSTASPTFNPVASVFPAVGAPAGIAVGDIDLDGLADVATANDSGGSVSFRLNNTAPNDSVGLLSGRVDFPSGNGPRSIVLADLNGDGRPELVTVSRLSNQVQVFQHNSQLGIAPAAFTGRVDFAGGVAPVATVAADINRDGKEDLVVANNSSSNFTVFVNNTVPGADVFDFLANNVSTGIPASGPTAVDALDLDGDGRLDVMCANATNGNVRAHLNTTTVGSQSISFAAGAGFGGPLATAAGLAHGDLTLDGRPDVIACQRGVSRVVLLRNITTLGGGPPAFTTLNVTSGAGPRGAAIADFNGDGKNDLVTANGSSSTITITLNATAPGGAVNLPTGTDFATDLNPSSVAVLDYNGDGKLDIVTANQGASNVTFYRNTTPPGSMTPVFNGRIEFPTGTGPAGLAVRDVNGDGRPDVVTTALDVDQVSILLNNTPPGGGQAFFNTITSSPVGDGPEGVAIGDFNGDGRPDIAAAAKLGSVVSVIRNITTP